jgi:hypothetical protein
MVLFPIARLKVSDISCLVLYNESEDMICCDTDT